MHISQLFIYPVKSLGGIALDEATLFDEGLANDRQWMVVDDIGRFVTQRQLPAMARVTVRLTADALVLEHPQAAPLAVPLSPGNQPRLPVYVWHDQCQALDEGVEAARWLGDVLGDWRGSGLRLVRFDEAQPRRVEPDFLQPGEQANTAFSDGYPFLVASQGSLDAVNRGLMARGLAALPMNRFRPNLVVSDIEPFAEDGWEALASADGAWRMGLRKLCQRCKITTVDQHSGKIDHPGEPLKTLMSLKPRLGLKGAFFGHNAILLDGKGQRLRVGDEVSATQRHT
ncbi:MOSC domain-containing protein [Halomonas urumqiensis]|uniref:MOSC domain-containing protein n=1 Tax=Halomonas urumqiensis TaxID=1684789 RepID=A0A2N7UDJ5_9GAMM|nr:MOSC N-terminal beta barrel domain-containing protein [Halomonas urumqiensis]PMR78461.1 MOSC domain-containing protein [Halomonas urumqiensis]PTB03606.1 MOSC domain-containing protein [Halomonas urumqiensis]GHE20186.1 MOSC domain-containing protein [Halomonas urumqiensis]